MENMVNEQVIEKVAETAAKAFSKKEVAIGAAVIGATVVGVGFAGYKIRTAIKAKKAAKLEEPEENVTEETEE